MTYLHRNKPPQYGPAGGVRPSETFKKDFKYRSTGRNMEVIFILSWTMIASLW